MLDADETELIAQVIEVERIVWPDTPLKDVKVKLRRIDELTKRVLDRFELTADPANLRMLNSLLGALLR